MEESMEKKVKLYMPLIKVLQKRALNKMAYSMYFGKDPTDAELDWFETVHESWDGQFKSNIQLENPFYRFRLWLHRRFEDR